MDDSIADCLVIGAGIAGLTAAHQLQKSGFRVVVTERSDYVGGRLRTVHLKEGAVEVGGAFISDFYAATLDLLTQVELEKSLFTRPQTAFVLRNRQSMPSWPAGELVRSPLLTVGQKIRLLGLLVPLARHWRALDIAQLGLRAQALATPADVLVGKWAGRAAGECFFGPLLQGLLYWRLPETSAHVMLAILKAFLRGKATYRLRNGMAELPARLALEADVRVGWDVRGIERNKSGQYDVQAMDSTGASRALHARSVVVATRAGAAMSLTESIAPWAVAFLQSVEYSRSTTFTFRTAPGETCPLPGPLLFPSSTLPGVSSINPLVSDDGQPTRIFGISINADYRRPAGAGLDALAMNVLRVVCLSLGSPWWLTSAKPVHVQDWPEALPKFDSGYLARLHDFRTAMASADTPVAFAGDYLDAPYIDGAVRSATKAADLVRSRLAGDADA
ncbi:oxygen-dependent protoporphyrinogen oxidase [Kribbella aluminosa]|uniref:Oxygen-dependent protoporphyrinogen oxidase n=1 Tax=Kribbella aluminosa TaxID=416017 RepID=A0ABS4UJG6_9ACTN|nr:NAD(P)/FAD-dependent oxidoreductase [Kribbella aluminosa]MBP2351792.1 oxygen-dependent protoporphyrinogen oxidase [Kribbella aluminosa]